MNVEARLRELGLELPSLIQLPPEVRAPFSWVRLYGDRAYISGQAPLNPDGTLAVFHGPRCLARYHADGRLIETAAESGRRKDPIARSRDRPIAAPRPTVREIISSRG